MTTETKTQYLLRNAKDSLQSYRDHENELRKALAAAAESTRKAKEKYEELFLKDQQEQVAALKKEYMHCTL